MKSLSLFPTYSLAAGALALLAACAPTSPSTPQAPGSTPVPPVTVDSEGNLQIKTVYDGPSGTFQGKFVFKPSGGTRAAQIVVSPGVDSGLFGVITYSSGERENLRDVQWSSESGTLSGEGTTLTSLGLSHISCNESELSTETLEVLRCVLSQTPVGTTTVKETKTIASGTFSQKRSAKTAPKTPATSEPIPTPVPAPAPVPAPQTPEQKLTRTFVGTAVFTSDEGSTLKREVKLTVQLATAPIGTVQPAKLKFTVKGTGVGADFGSSSFEASTGRLLASQIVMHGALPGSLTLECAGVDFANSQYDFPCRYESSVTSVRGEFQMKPKVD